MFSSRSPLKEKADRDRWEKNKAVPPTGNTGSDLYMYAMKSQNLAFWIFLCGFLFNLVGFFAPYWFNAVYTGYGHSQGLWRWCILWPVFPQCTKMKVQQEWFKWLQALELLGFVASVISLVLISVFKFTTKFKVKSVATWTIGTCFTAAFFELIGICVLVVAIGIVDRNLFTVGEYSNTFFTIHHISWACFLTFLGASMYTVAGWLMFQMHKVSF